MEDERDNNSAWKITQLCTLPTGDYDRNQFFQYIENLPFEDFNRFCRQILHLRHYYDNTTGAHVTDMLSIVNEHPDKFWELERIDFDDPINFTML